MVGRNSVIDRKVAHNHRRQMNKWVINIIKGMDKGTAGGGSPYFTIRIERKHRPPLILRVHRNRLYINTKNHHKSHSTKTAGTKNGRREKSKPYMDGRKGKNNPELNSSNSTLSSGHSQNSSRSGNTNGRDVTNSMLEAAKRSVGRRNGVGYNGSEDGSDETISKMDLSYSRAVGSKTIISSDSEQRGANRGRNAMNGRAGASWTVDTKKEYWSSRYGGKGGGGGNIAERDEGNDGLRSGGRGRGYNNDDDDGTGGERKRDKQECNCGREHCRCAGRRQNTERNSAKVQRFLPRYGLGEWGKRSENIDGTFKMEYSSPKHWGGHIMNDWDIEKSPDDELANLKPEFITIINGVRIIGKVDEIANASKFRPEFSKPLNSGGSKMEAKKDVSVIDLNSESSLFRNGRRNGGNNDRREDGNVTNNFKQENGGNIEGMDVKMVPNFRNGDKESGKVGGTDGGGNEMNLQLGSSPVENEFLSPQNGSREGGNMEAKKDQSAINLKSESSSSARNGRRHSVTIEEREDVTNSNRELVTPIGRNIERSKIKMVVNGGREGVNIASGTGNVKKGENETSKSLKADSPANGSREGGNVNGEKEDGNVLNLKLETSSAKNGSNEGRNVVNSKSESLKLRADGSGSGQFDGIDGGNVSGSKIESSQLRDRVGGETMNSKLESSSAQNGSSEDRNVVNSKSESSKFKTEESGSGKFDGRDGGNVSGSKIEPSQIRNRDGGNKMNSKLDSSSAKIGTSKEGIVSEREVGIKTSSKLETLSAIKAKSAGDIVNERHGGNRTSSSVGKAKSPKLESSAIKNGSNEGVKIDGSDRGNGTRSKLESSSSGNGASNDSHVDAGMDGGYSKSSSMTNEERGSRSIDREGRNVGFKFISSSSKNGKKGGGRIDQTGRNVTNTKLESSTTKLDGKKDERNAKTKIKQRFFMPRFTIKMVKNKNAHRSTCGCEKLRCKGGVLEPKPKVQLVFRKMLGGGKNIRGNVKTTSKRVSDAVPRNSNIERPSVSKVRPSMTPSIPN